MYDLDPLICLTHKDAGSKGREKVVLDAQGRPAGSWPFGSSRHYLINRSAEAERRGLRLLSLPNESGTDALVLLLDYSARCAPETSALKLAQALHQGEHPQAVLDSLLRQISFDYLRAHPGDLLSPLGAEGLLRYLEDYCMNTLGLKIRCKLRPEGSEYTQIYYELRQMAAIHRVEISPYLQGLPQNYEIQISVQDIQPTRLCWLQFITRKPTHKSLYEEVENVLKENLSRKDLEWHEKIDVSESHRETVRKWICERLVKEFGVVVEVSLLQRIAPERGGGDETEKTRLELVQQTERKKIHATHQVSVAQIDAQRDSVLRQIRINQEILDEEMLALKKEIGEIREYQRGLRAKLMEVITNDPEDVGRQKLLRNALNDTQQDLETLHQKQQNAQARLGTLSMEYARLGAGEKDHE